ncbi:MAG: CDGSH iron-sulfur domain-containing protein [Candidatus Limiplasma sp.]|nr:CDGSH iron-sulfur domain-containing protein [Candidatus Limiplasma sp.]
MGEKRIRIVENGPFVVSGGIPLQEEAMVGKDRHREYETIRTFEVGEEYALCRCGHTKTPPFCDGAHAHASFNGGEIASREPYYQRARVFRGETLDLYDDGRCAYARFCHRRHGSVWRMTEESDVAEIREEAIRAACDCPTGRLVQHDKTAGYAQIEPDFEPSIAVLQDTEREISGPLYVKGRIPLTSADGTEYETRNRYALCRCGASRNMPFCDAMHITTRYKDSPEEENPESKGNWLRAWLFPESAKGRGT